MEHSCSQHTGPHEFLCTDTAMRLEQRGLAASWSGLRFAFATGGDGESDMRVDMRNFAAFVRDPAALVTCLCLPHSCSVRFEMQVMLHKLAINSHLPMLRSSGCVKAQCLRPLHIWVHISVGPHHLFRYGKRFC